MKRILIFFFLLFCTFISQIVEAKDYMLVCGKQDGVAKVWYLDLETSLSTGVSVVVGETELKDESGNVITATPLGITSDGQKIFWVSFDDRRIRKYNISGEPEKVDITNWYWQVSNSPDGLYYAGSGLQYCSSSNNKIYRINISNGMETDLGVVSRRLSLDGVSPDSVDVRYTTQEYASYNPTCISTNYLCSLGKISKKAGNNLIQTMSPSAPMWINEQDTPAPCVGIAQVTDYLVPEGHVIYLSCTDGNVYKVRFVDKTYVEVTPSGVGLAWKGEGFFAPLWYSSSWYEPPPGIGMWGAHCGREQVNWLSTTRMYFKLIPPTSFIKAFAIHRPSFYNHLQIYAGSLASATYSICSFDENWPRGGLFTYSPMYNDPILSTLLWTKYYDGTGSITGYGGVYSDVAYETSPRVKITDVTDKMPTTTFYYTGRYDDEGQAFPWSPSPMARHFHIVFPNQGTPGRLPDVWSFLTNNGSLEILDQFTTTPSSIDSQDITVTKNLSIAKDIHTDPVPFYPSLETDPASKTKISYRTIVKPEKVGFEIRNLITSSLIYRIDLPSTEPVNPGKLLDEYEYEWNGKDTAGQIVSKGLYSINVKLKDSQNNLLYDSATSPQLYAYAYSPTINTSARTATFNYRVWAWGTTIPETAKVYMNLYDDEFRLIKKLLVKKEIPVNQQQTVTWNYSAYAQGKYYYTIYAEDKRGEQAHIRGGSFTVPDHQIVGTREPLPREKTGWKYEGPVVRVRNIGMAAVGDSVTAGMQHFTLVDYLQQDGYTNLLARQMGIDKFDLPLIKPPGAGIPLFQTDAQGRIIPDVHLTPGTGVQIGLEFVSQTGSRIQPDIFAHNVAVPGATTNQVLNTQTYRRNRLFELVLQGRFDETGRGTEVTQAVFMRPNLIILWTGNNDVLGAAIFANLNELTDPPNTEPVIFEEAFREIVRRLKERTDPDGPTGPLKGADIIVSDIPDVSSIPNLFRVGEQVGDLPFEVFRRRWGTIGPTENVTNQVENFVIPRGVNGRRGEQYPEGTLIPMFWLFRYFFMDISPFNAGPNANVFVEDRVLTTGVDLNGDGEFDGPGEFDNEIEQIKERTNQINNIIRTVAREYNLPVVSANDLLRSVDTSFAGGNFSFDGIHPSSRGHRLVANEFIKKLNEVIQERGSFGKRGTPIDELTIDP